VNQIAGRLRGREAERKGLAASSLLLTNASATFRCASFDVRLTFFLR